MVFAENYPGLGEETRPIIVTVGDSDPLCPPLRLFEHLTAVGADSVYPLVMPGDHGMRVGSAEATQRNVELVARTNVHWLQALLHRNTGN